MSKKTEREGVSQMSSRAGIIRGLTVIFCAKLLVSQARPASAQKLNVNFDVSGTSTVRGWTCSVSGVMDVTAGTGAAAKPAPGFTTGVQTATLTVPVKGFKCPEEEMGKHLLTAIKADKFADIVFRLVKYEVMPGGGRGQGPDTQAQVTGTLTITGVPQPVTVPVTLRTTDQGVQFEGNARLELMKFRIEPPVVMLGLFKVGPQIRIDFKGVAPR